MMDNKILPDRSYPEVVVVGFVNTYRYWLALSAS